MSSNEIIGWVFAVIVILLLIFVAFKLIGVA